MMLSINLRYAIKMDISLCSGLLFGFGSQQVCLLLHVRPMSGCLFSHISPVMNPTLHPVSAGICSSPTQPFISGDTDGDTDTDINLPRYHIHREEFGLWRPDVWWKTCSLSHNSHIRSFQAVKVTVMWHCCQNSYNNNTSEP